MASRRKTTTSLAARARTASRRQKGGKTRAAKGSAGSEAAPKGRERRGRAQEGSKKAQLVARLIQPNGAKLADLTKDLGWLPHTVRAALTGLRHKGYAVTREKDAEGKTVYRATPPVEAEKTRRDRKKAA